MQLIKRVGSYLHHDHLPGNIKFKLILTQKTFTCSKSATETIENSVKYVKS